MEDEKIRSMLWERKEKGLFYLQEKYTGYCKTVAGRILSDKEDVQECLNDVWLKMWNSIPPNAPETLKGYLAKVTRNQAMDVYRRETADKRGGNAVEADIHELAECLTAGDSIAQRVDEAHLIQTIQIFLENQNGMKRRIFLQRYFYCMELSEIADSVHKKESSVRSILSRMRKELKGYLEKEGIWV